MSGRSRRLLAGAVVVVLVLVLAGAGAIVVLRASTSSTAALPAPVFVDETVSSGLEHTYDGGVTFYTGGGVAVLDCNDDGRPDLYLAGGANPAELFRNDSAPGGALRFSRLPDPTTDLTGVTGAYPIDIDADGHADLAVLRVGGVRAAARPGRLPVPAGQRRLGVPVADHLDDGVQRHLGRLGIAPHARDRLLRRARRVRPADDHVRGQ